MKVFIKAQIFLCLSIVLALGCTAGSSGRLIQLPSGNKIVVLSQGPIYFHSSDPAMMLKYQTALDITDRAGLLKEANEVWIKFQPYVEKNGFHHAVLSANDRPHGFILTTNSSYNFVYDQNADSSWQLLPDKKNP